MRDVISGLLWAIFTLASLIAFLDWMLP